MSMRKLTGKAAILAAVIATSAALAVSAGEPSITVNSATQRWPWNNKLDVTYTVTNGQDRATGLYCGVEFTITDGGNSYVLPGYTIGASGAGDADGTTHTVTFTAPAGIRSANCTISATLFTTNVPSGNDYMIVNLSSGEVYYEGLMETQELSNDRYNVAEYKEGKMVLRKVPKWADHGDLPNADALTALGGYPTGDNVNYSSSNSRRYWTTDKDYYVGVFLVTQAQYARIGADTGSTPSGNTKVGRGDTVTHRPVEKVCYNDLRISGTPSTSPVPAVSAAGTGTFLQRLNYLTGNQYGFDLPTSIMSEIAERAGATGEFSWEGTYEDSPNYAECNGRTYGSRAVGSLLPNNWGLYDTAGNVWEWTLDLGVTTSDNMASRTDPFEPIYNSSSLRPTIVGGADWRHTLSASTFRASSQTRNSNSYNVGSRQDHVGFRLFYIVK